MNSIGSIFSSIWKYYGNSPKLQALVSAAVGYLVGHYDWLASAAGYLLQHVPVK